MTGTMGNGKVAKEEVKTGVELVCERKHRKDGVKAGAGLMEGKRRGMVEKNGIKTGLRGPGIQGNGEVAKEEMKTGVRMQWNRGGGRVEGLPVEMEMIGIKRRRN
mmetsp:Transcript_37805/g.62799  ORF Transcript_37805/g.62799 Transcript_37805/m.62799 type:complete len:105 (+) Transcript_37805:179-493(+)